MKARTKAPALLLLLLLLVPAPAPAGWIIHEKGLDGAPLVIYLQKNKILNDNPAISTLVDLDQGRISLVNKPRKIYWTGALEEFEQEMMAAIDRQVDQQMKDLPAEQRQAMKDRLKAGLQGRESGVREIEVVRTGKAGQVAGRECEQYEVKVKGQVSEEHWIAPSVNVAREIDLDKMRNQLAKLKMTGGPGGLGTAGPVLDLWAKGYPLKKVYLMMGQRMVTQAVKVEQKDIPDKTFLVPDSFLKSEVMEVLAGH